MVVDLHMRQVERDRDVARSAVDADRAAGRRQAIDEGAQIHRRPDLGRGAERRGDAPGSRLLLGIGTRQGDPRPAATRRRPSSIQLASGQSLSAREVPWMKAIGADASASGAAAPRPNAGEPAAEVPSARATSSRERSSAWLCGSTRIACVTSQRAGHSWLAPSVRLARPQLGPRASRLTSADLVSPCRSITAS
jgi:hypothetical protein